MRIRFAGGRRAIDTDRGEAAVHAGNCEHGLRGDANGADLAHWKSVLCLGSDVVAYVSGLGFEELRLGVNRHGVRGRAYFEFNVDACGLQLLDGDAGPQVLLESGKARTYYIRAGG